GGASQAVEEDLLASRNIMRVVEDVPQRVNVLNESAGGIVDVADWLDSAWIGDAHQAVGAIVRLAGLVGELGQESYQIAGGTIGVVERVAGGIGNRGDPVLAVARECNSLSGGRGDAVGSISEGDMIGVGDGLEAGRAADVQDSAVLQGQLELVGI